MATNKKQSNYLFFSFKWFNKYLIAALLFLSWIIFFDNNNLVNQYKLAKTVQKLENEKFDYLAKLELAKEEKTILDQNKERYAREKYYMHKDNEAVYIIEREEK